MDPFNNLYSKKVLKHFNNPQNVGTIRNPDGVATVGNPVCGDIMKLYIKVGKKDNKDYIKNIKFQTLGCGAAIATSSMITILVKGKSIEKALKVSKATLIKELDGLPVNKLHCSLLAEEALKKAIKDYYNKIKLNSCKYLGFGSTMS